MDFGQVKPFFKNASLHGIGLLNFSGYFLGVQNGFPILLLLHHFRRTVDDRFYYRPLEPQTAVPTVKNPPLISFLGFHPIRLQIGLTNHVL